MIRALTSHKMTATDEKWAVNRLSGNFGWATGKVGSVRFDYGQAVLHESLAAGMITTRPGSIVGITPVETPTQVVHFGYPLGTVLYTIEFSDGTDQLVPESELSEM